MKVLFFTSKQRLMDLVDSDFVPVPVQSIEEIAQQQGAGRVAALVAGLDGESASPVESLARLKGAAPGLPILLMRDEWEVGEAVKLAQVGAFQLLTPAVSREDLNAWLRQAAEAVTETTGGEDLAERPWKQFLVGESWPMRVLGEVVRLVAPRRCTVLITGETGTGKEMVARALHASSPRAEMPMVSINCSALPAELLEAELFGHVKGAFTGAFTTRTGRIERANRGTLFLDEIGDMPLALQAKLLRVLQEREFQPVGSSETIKVDIRVIAATNANLEERVRQGKFREDLYYRLNVAPIYLPPLRQRAADVPLLTRHFVHKTSRAEGMAPKSVLPEAIAWLSNHPWPGNVRQLENAVEMALALSGSRPVLTLSDFTPVMMPGRDSGMFAVPEEGLDYNAVVDQFERNILERALQLASGSKKRAADLLRLKRTTFAAKIKSLSIETRDVEDETEACEAAVA